MFIRSSERFAIFYLLAGCKEAALETSMNISKRIIMVDVSYENFSSPYREAQAAGECWGSHEVLNSNSLRSESMFKIYLKFYWHLFSFKH